MIKHLFLLALMCGVSTTAFAAASAPPAVTSIAGLSGTLTASQLAAVLVVTAANPNGGIAGTTTKSISNLAGERLSLSDYGATYSSEPTGWASFISACNAKGGVIHYSSPGAQGWVPTARINTAALPESCNVIAEGPNVHGEPWLGWADNTTATGLGIYGRLPSNHTSSDALLDFSASALGSGTGSNPDGVMRLRIIKDNWATTQVAGGIGALAISVSGGGPSTTSNDTFGADIFVQCGYNSGFCNTFESNTTEKGSDGTSATGWGNDIQLGIEDQQGGVHIGEQFVSTFGQHQAAMRTVGSSSTGYWGDVLYNSKDSIHNYEITDDGYVITKDTAGSNDIIEYKNLGGVETVINGSGTILRTLDQNGNISFPGALQDSAPLQWTSGNSYILGNVVVAGGITYRLINNSCTAANQPVQTSGNVTGADSCNWQYIAMSSTPALLQTNASGQLIVPVTFGIKSATTDNRDITIQSANGSPSGNGVAYQGSLFLRHDGGFGRTLYIKEVDGGATGWDPTITATTTQTASALIANNTQATAYVLTTRNTIFATVTSGGGAILSGTMPDEQVIVNAGANALLIWPPTGGVINGHAANASISLAAGSEAQCLLANSLLLYCTANTLP